MTAGVAFNAEGKARAGMGIDAADFDGSGRPGLVIGNFSNEMISLYRNEGSGLFVDDASATVIGRASLLTLAFARSSSTPTSMAGLTSSRSTATSPTTSTRSSRR